MSGEGPLRLKDDDRISLVYDERGNPDFNSFKKADGTPIDVTPNNGKVEIEYAPLDPNLGTEASKTKPEEKTIAVRMRNSSMKIES